MGLRRGSEDRFARTANSKRERRDERTIWHSVSTVSSKAAFYVLAVGLVTAFGFGANIQRRDSFIAGGAGQLHVREVSGGQLPASSAIQRTSIR